MRNYVHCRLRAIGLQLILYVMPALSMALERSNAPSLILAERWSDAARAILREAAAINPSTGDLPAAQSRAGYLDDALNTISRMHPSSQSWGYLTLVRGTPKLDPEDESTAARSDGRCSARRRR